MKKIVIMTIAVLSIMLFCACDFNGRSDSPNVGIEINLDESYYKYDSSGRYEYSVTNGKINFGVKRVLFSSSKNINKLSTDESASQRIDQENKRRVLRKDVTYSEEYGYSNYEFFETEGNNTRVFFVFVFKSSNAFYFCDFSCLQQNADECSPMIYDLALTIKPIDGKFIFKVDEDKTFTSGIGITITLNHTFSVTSLEKYAYSLTNGEVVFGVTRTLFSSEREIGKLTTTDWANRVIAENNIQNILTEQVKYDEDNNYSVYHYAQTSENKEKIYYSYVLKNSSGFFECEFS